MVLPLCVSPTTDILREYPTSCLLMANVRFQLQHNPVFNKLGGLIRHILILLYLLESTAYYNGI